jgi:hypothetical protein
MFYKLFSLKLEAQMDPTQNQRGDLKALVFKTLQISAYSKLTDLAQ